MKTLYKRLKPKAKKAIDEQGKNYPLTRQALITELKLVKFADELCVSSAIKVYEAYYPRKDFRIHEFYELFND